MTFAVSYLYLHRPEIASARYRCIIPFQEMHRSYGVRLGHQILVASKHSWEWDKQTAGFDKVVFDVCDNHFHTKHRAHYMNACEKADLVTCNSDAMRSIIQHETGRLAVVIDDPYEDEERAPSVGDSLLWFGHASNMEDLLTVAPRLQGYDLTVVSNHVDSAVIPWSEQTLDAELRQCGMVIIPTGKSMAKSANRAIKAIRYGKFAVCGPLPAHEEIPGLWVGDIREGVEWALSHKDKALERIKAAQSAIAYRFSPERIGAKWWGTLRSVLT